MAEPAIATTASPRVSLAENDLADRLRRIEEQLAAAPPTAVVVPPSEEQIAQKVFTILAEKASQYRQSTIVPPIPGLNTAALMIPRPQAAFGDAPPGAIPADLGEAFQWRSWLFTQVFAEFRLIQKMYFDPRYRLSRIAQLGVPALFGLMTLNYILFNLLLISIPIFSPVMERLFLIALAIVLYKVLAREAVRYKQVLEYLSQYGYA
ncbi:MAG: hypothetical protein ACRCZF_19120 [Gemmataceae bacterium]